MSLPLEPWLAKKWDAIGRVLDFEVLNAGSGTGDPRFRLLPDAALSFYTRLVPEIGRTLRRRPVDVVVASDPYIGAAALAARRLTSATTKVVVEVHGDPRTFTRGYGSSARRIVSPLSDAIARYGLRHADATRALSRFTSSLIEGVRGVPATASFPTYSDLSAFADPPRTPVPDDQRLLFVAALEQYKNVDGLAAAWRRVVVKVPGATLAVVGNGSRRDVVDRLVEEMPGRVEHYPWLPPDRVAEQMDRARALVLPSWPEGLGRVVLEAFARGRTSVATNAGGIRDIITDGHDGILIPIADTDALVHGMRRILEDRELAVRLGEAAHASYAPWHQTADDFARSYGELVERTLNGAR